MCLKNYYNVPEKYFIIVIFTQGSYIEEKNLKSYNQGWPYIFTVEN